MGRHKGDGLGRFGGRAKGTTNKPKLGFDTRVMDLIERNRRQIELELKRMDTEQRVMVLTGLMHLVDRSKVETPKEEENGN